MCHSCIANSIRIQKYVLHCFVCELGFQHQEAQVFDQSKSWSDHQHLKFSLIHGSRFSLHQQSSARLHHFNFTKPQAHLMHLIRILIKRLIGYWLFGQDLISYFETWFKNLNYIFGVHSHDLISSGSLIHWQLQNSIHLIQNQQLIKIKVWLLAFLVNHRLLKSRNMKIGLMDAFDQV